MIESLNNIRDIIVCDFLERYKDGAYCIFALPIEWKGRLYIVELLKKVTADDFFSDLFMCFTAAKQYSIRNNHCRSATFLEYTQK